MKSSDVGLIFSEVRGQGPLDPPSIHLGEGREQFGDNYGLKVTILSPGFVPGSSSSTEIVLPCVQGRLCGGSYGTVMRVWFVADPGIFVQGRLRL